MEAVFQAWGSKVKRLGLCAFWKEYRLISWLALSERRQRIGGRS
jgi:hypothetical protein